MMLEPPVPGHLCTRHDTDFAEVRYVERIPICKRNVSDARKDKICRRDGVIDRRNYTVDHVVPLALGGSNKDANLWCQHKSIAVTSIEYLLYRQLLTGEINQQYAIQTILKIKFRND